jgi:hypothetical protein
MRLLGALLVAVALVVAACVGADPDSVATGRDAGAADSSADATEQQEVDAGPPKAVFVTSTQVSGGKIGGAAGADKICNDLVPGKTFKAWLSIGGDGPIKRINWKGGYERLFDKQLVVANRKELTSGTLRAPIAIDEKGNTVAPGLPARVWTNTNAQGETAEVGYDCGGFTADIPDGGGPKSAHNGVATATNGEWTYVQSSAVTCVEEARLYCFED